MGKPGKNVWTNVRQAFKDALPENLEFKRVDCLNLLMLLAHNPDEKMSLEDLETRLPDLSPQIEPMVLKLIELGLLRYPGRQFCQLSPKAKDIVVQANAPKETEAD